MAGVHEIPGFGPLAGLEEIGELRGALDFGDDVAGAAEGERVELTPMILAARSQSARRLAYSPLPSS
jgi:hypothetical protein